MLTSQYPLRCCNRKKKMKKQKQFVYNVYKIVFTKITQVIGNDTYTSYTIDLKLKAQFNTAKETQEYLNIKAFNGVNHGLIVDNSDMRNGKPEHIAKAIHTSKGYTVIKDSIEKIEAVR